MVTMAKQYEMVRKKFIKDTADKILSFRNMNRKTYQIEIRRLIRILDAVYEAGIGDGIEQVRSSPADYLGGE
jgi:hypothetical protein